MTTVEDFLRILGHTAPVISSLICLVMLLLCYQDRDKNTQTRLLKVLIAYYMAAAIGWITTFFYIYIPLLFVYTGPLAYLCFLCVPVVFYHLVFIITGTEHKQRFSYIHYLIPVAICLALTIWSFFVPYDVQLHIIESRGDYPESYKWYAVFFTSKLPARATYSLIYTTLGLISLIRYRKVISDYSTEADRTSMRWFYLLLILSFTLLPLPFAALFVSKACLVSSLFSLIPIILLVIQHTILCYNMIMNNYVIIEPPKKCETPVESQRKIDKKTFEHYIQEQKPYLNPQLKITDLTVEFHTNRTYLSMFINREYGMNFSRYINRCRLQEFEKMRNDKQYSSYDCEVLLMKAGFNNYRAYQRVKQAEENNLDL